MLFVGENIYEYIFSSPWRSKGSPPVVFTHPKDLLAGGKDLSLLPKIRHEPSPTLPPPPPLFHPLTFLS